MDHGQVVALGTPQEVKAQLLEETLIVDAADRDGLRDELSRLHLRFTENGSFEVGLQGRGAHEVVGLLRTPLTLLRTESPTLEDAYLRILAHD
jgi:ABC-2 type transport system ATP-binding protein